MHVHLETDTGDYHFQLIFVVKIQNKKLYGQPLAGKLIFFKGGMTDVSPSQL